MRMWRCVILWALMAICLSGERIGMAQPKPHLPPIHAVSAILVEDATGAELFAKDPDRPLPPASTTKIVTGMLLARDLPPETLIPVSPRAAATPGHRLGLHAGDRLPARDMLYAILLVSANDASTAVAERMDGTEARFADRMNQEARRVGAARTHFVNPHGLPAPGHLSTVRDLATLAHAALGVPAFAAAVRTSSYPLSAPNDHLPATLNNQDTLLTTVPGSEGGKTGYTREAGYCYVGTATRNGRRLIVAVLNSPDWQGEAKQLLEYGFSRPAAPKPTPSPPSSAHTSSGDPSSPGSPPGITGAAGSPGGMGTASASPSLGPGSPGGEASPSAPAGWGGKPAAGSGTPPVGTGSQLPRASSKQLPQPGEKGTSRPPDKGRPKETSSASVTSSQGSGLPAQSTPRSLWWLWLLLLLLLLLWIMRRYLARRGNPAMNRFGTAFAGLLRRKPSAPRSIRRPSQAPVVPAKEPEPKKAAYTFSSPCVPRLPSVGWLEKLMETPPRMLEPAVRRQASAILDAHPQRCSDKLMGLLGSNTLKVRLAACQLLAQAFPRRSEETLQALIKEERIPNDVRQSAAETLARSGGERYEPTWKEMLLRDGFPAAAHALARQPRLEPVTKQALQQALSSRASEKYTDDAARRNVQSRTAHIALTLAAHSALSPEEAQSFLRPLPDAPREQAITQTLRGVATPWAVKQMVQIALTEHAYPALLALTNASPRLVRAALDELDNPSDAVVHTRARIARWLLLKEGDAEGIQQLAQAGNETATNALNLAHFHHWQPAQASPDALLAAAQIVSLRIGFSDHAPEQIERAFRQVVTGDADPEQMAETPELQPLADAYKNPEVYDAVQAALHTDDGLNTLLGEIARHPEQPQYAIELAFWSDKTTRETRVQIAQALAHVRDVEATEALMECAEDTCSAVRNAALRALQIPAAQEPEASELQEPPTEPPTELPTETPDVPDAVLDQAA